MSTLYQQSQLFMASAAMLLCGLLLLLAALGLYGMVLDRILRAIGIHGAIAQYIFDNRDAWWFRIGTWYMRTFRRGR